MNNTSQMTLVFEQLPVGTLLRALRSARPEGVKFAAGEAWIHKYRQNKYRQMGLSAPRQLLPKELVVMLGCIGGLPEYQLMPGERLVELLTHDGVEVLSCWEDANVETWFEVV